MTITLFGYVLAGPLAGEHTRTIPLRGWAVQDAGPDEDQAGYFFAGDNPLIVGERLGLAFTLDQLRRMVTEAEAIAEKYGLPS